MSDLPDDLVADYFVIVTHSAASSWRWEIRRKSRPLGIRLSEGNYRSKQAARLAGEKALRDFLLECWREMGGR